MTEPALFERNQAAAPLLALARRGVYLGTSSWKYPGWRGQLYTDDRYIYRGRFAERRFEANCLGEYAEVFRTVGVDATYYRFPDQELIKALTSQVPPDFKLSFKVTDEITVKRFAALPRYGSRAGQPNPGFLDAGLFASRFLQPCEAYRERVGVLMFEFSRFYPDDFARGRDFVEALRTFLSALPGGWRYAVEIRNPTFLRAEYLQVLADCQVAHVFSSWGGMPALADQWAIAATQRRAANHAVARLLLRPGREYEEAVRRFSPYRELCDPYPEGREAAVTLMENVLQRRGPHEAFVYVNNRFEGNALQTVAALLKRLKGEAPASPAPAPG